MTQPGKTLTLKVEIKLRSAAQATDALPLGQQSDQKNDPHTIPSWSSASGIFYGQFELSSKLLASWVSEYFYASELPSTMLPTRVWKQDGFHNSIEIQFHCFPQPSAALQIQKENKKSQRKFSKLQTQYWNKPRTNDQWRLTAADLM